MSQPEFVEVQIIALVEDQKSGNPIVVLWEKNSNRVLPIWIGNTEAQAIGMALNKVATPRPLTHKLFPGVIQAMGGKLQRIAIDRLKNNTYYASLFINVGTNQIIVDARPSDSLAIALNAGVPIVVARKIMDVASHENPFPSVTAQQRTQRTLQNLQGDELQKIKDMLDQARQREEKSTES